MNPELLHTGGAYLITKDQVYETRRRTNMAKIRCVVLVVLLALFAGGSYAAKNGKVSANGLSFAYVDEGSGTPVVLVHGSVSDYREWSKQMSQLARHYRVIAYSRRYH